MDGDDSWEVPRGGDNAKQVGIVELIRGVVAEVTRLIVPGREDIPWDTASEYFAFIGVRM